MTEQAWNPATAPFKISAEEFRVIADLIYKHFGIHLSGQKVPLVEGRLQKLLRKHGFTSFDQYYSWLTDPRGDVTERMGELVDRMSTNHTFFWRENAHFEIFEKDLLPRLEQLRAKERKIRIWCAACSYGQEAYTLAIALRAYFGDRYKNWDAGLLATDISRNALEHAQAGIYPANDVAQLPPRYRDIGFQRLSDGTFQAREEIRKDITFRRFNLMNEMPFRGTFDVIFCRNVMIYFDAQTRRQVVQRMYNQTSTPGWFFTSLSESLDRNTCPYGFHSPGVYCKT